MIQGTVPYPQWANSGPIRTLATSLKQFSQGIGEQSDVLMNVKEQASSSWLGEAAKMFAKKQDDRNKTMKQAMAIFGKCAAPLDQFATLIDTTKAAYTAAAGAEMVARAGLPYTAAALKAAILAEKQIVFGQFYAGGTAIAGQLAMLELEAAALMFAGIDRSQFESVKSTLTTAWQMVSEEMGEGDVKSDDALRQFNEIYTTVSADGSSVRSNPVSSSVNAQPCLAGPLENLLAVTSPLLLLSQPEVVAQPQDPAVLAQLQGDGFRTDANLSHGQRADNVAMLDELGRNLGPGVLDQSTPVHAQMGQRADGSRVLSVTVPGMHSPGDAVVPNGTGQRVLPYAASSQTTGTGQFEASMLGWVRQQNLQPGDTINLYGYSQGGIVTRNITESLRTEGYNVNLVTYASPEGPMGGGTDATMFQNTRDLVPIARAGGAGAETLALEPNQRIVQFDAGAGDDQHDIRHYGRYLDNHADDPAIRDYNARQEAQNRGTEVVSNQIIYFGHPTPANGQSITVSPPALVGSGGPR